MREVLKINSGDSVAVALTPLKAGDTVEFGGLLGFAPVMPVNPWHNDEFIARGGRIPAPLHSLKN